MMTSSDAPLPEGYEYSANGQYAVFTKPIEASLNDNRTYRMIRLPNEMEITLVHDATIDKSAASLDVHVGNLTDPKHLPGLAHFLEHLLFTGTKKYPEENAYIEYVSKHAGATNATTFLDNTTYHFNIGHEHLEGALDRLSQFFISPVFSENMKDREIRAVDSEFKRNLNNDYRRLFHLSKTLCNRDHPYSRFGSGNLVSLEEIPAKEGIDVREELIAFYHKYYSSNIMKACIVGRESLDQLTEWAVEKFSEIRNLNIAPPKYTTPLWTSKELLDELKNYRVKPSIYIKHLLGHKGTGSVLSLLKRLGWGNDLDMETMVAGIGNHFLKMTVELTKEGLVHHEDIIVVVFQYIQLMQKNGVQNHIWEEIESLATTAFRFKEKGNINMYVYETVRNMQHIPQREWILSGNQLIKGRDDALVEECIAGLRIDNWRALITTMNTDIVPGGAFTQREPWFGIEYHVQDVSESLLQRLANIELHPDLHLPVPNPFIPQDFETHKPQTKACPPAQNHPDLIKTSPLVRLWHKKDDTFWVPKVVLQFTLKFPMACVSPLHQAKAYFIRYLLEDMLTEEVYSAELAGLKYGFLVAVEGFKLEIQGYHNKANVLLETVLRALKNFKVNPERFQSVKDQLYRDYQNVGKSTPSGQGVYWLNYLNKEVMWSFLEQSAEVDAITPADCEIFVKDVLERLFIEGLIVGNTSRSQALEAGWIVEEVLGSRPLTSSESIKKLRSRVFPPGFRAVYPRANTDGTNVNSSIQYYLQVDTKVTFDALDQQFRETKALTMVLGQILDEPCFNQLRTVEQLGYIVQGSTHEDAGTMGIKVTIQSEYDPIFLEHRIEQFFRGRLREMLENMTQEELNKQIESTAVKRLEKSKNLREEATKYWTVITAGTFEFDQAQNEADEMRKITVERLREFFAKWIHPDSEHVRKLSVHIRSHKLPAQEDEFLAVTHGPKKAGAVNTEGGVDGNKEKEDEKEVEEETLVRLREGTVLIKNEAEFKSKLEMSRASLPVVDLVKHYFKE
ncbi:hypothetical protein EMPS_05702 [Entomortierella parvispora]|uniref:Insulin-degrading enzyme n=1 Tax=Entomortierella parvispora TaxID=205924 RepID=A0A9P3LWS6_9FUNG|nr:hypothetical protein EMPS_05702 [Entomortierella parvispora]